MSVREFHFHDGEIGAALAVRILERKKQNKIDKILKDGTVIIDIKGAPKDLNTTLAEFLGKELGINPEQIEIIAGERRDEKLISILDIEPKKLQNLILNKIS